MEIDLMNSIFIFEAATKETMATTSQIICFLKKKYGSGESDWASEREERLIKIRPIALRLKMYRSKGERFLKLNMG